MFVKRKLRARKAQNITYGLATSVSLVTFLIYLSSLRNEFVEWDDRLYVFGNPHICSLNFSFLKWAFSTYHGANWHPLTWASHALDYAVWGLDPLGHHLTNIVLHSVNAFLVVLLIARLLEAWKVPSPSPDRAKFIAAATTGLLFGLHPLHVESVAWVAERKDLLCALFFLLSILSYTAYATYRTYTKYLFSLGFFALALLSKPMAVSLPVVLLILDWFPFRRLRSIKSFGSALFQKLPFIALSLISSVLTVMAQKTVGAIQSIETVPLPSRVMVAVESLMAYLWKMVLPVDLVPFYPYPKNLSLSSPEYIIPVVLVTGISMFCVSIAAKQRVWLSVWGYYVVTLIPVLGIVQVGGQSMADRYTYLPSLGPFLLAGLSAAWVFQKVNAPGKRGFFITLVFSFTAVVAFVSLSYLTSKQIRIWNNSINLWSYVITKEPERVPLAYNNLGIVLEERGRSDEAIACFRKALILDPYYAKAHNNLGNAYYRRGLLDDAIREYRIALSLKPDYQDALDNLSVVFAMKEAITSHKK